MKEIPPLPKSYTKEDVSRAFKNLNKNVIFLNNNYLRPDNEYDLDKKGLLKIELYIFENDPEKLKKFDEITEETLLKLSENSIDYQVTYNDYSMYFNWMNEFITPEKKQKYLETVLYKLYDVPESIHSEYEHCFDDYTMDEMLNREKIRDYHRIYKKMYPDTELTFMDFLNGKVPEMFI